MDAGVVVAEIGHCGFAEPSDDGAIACPKPGKKIRVRDPLGGLVVICRCRDHSDWVEEVH